MNRHKELLELIKENPSLEVIPMVDTDVVQGDDYSSWHGSFGKARVEEYARHLMYHECDEIVFKDDTERLEEYLLDNHDLIDGEDVEEYIKNLDWKKAIIVYIELPEIQRRCGEFDNEKRK